MIYMPREDDIVIPKAVFDLGKMVKTSSVDEIRTNLANIITLTAVMAYTVEKVIDARQFVTDVFKETQIKLEQALLELKE